MIRDSLITDSRDFRFFNAGPGMLGPCPNSAGNCWILEARIGESLWPTSNDLQSDWTSKIPKNKYRYLFFVIFDFSCDSVIQNHQKLEKHHLFDFLHFETCSFNEILFIFVTSLSDSSSKNHHNFAVQCWKCRNSQVASFQCRMGNYWDNHREGMAFFDELHLNEYLWCFVFVWTKRNIFMRSSLLI